MSNDSTAELPEERPKKQDKTPLTLMQRVWVVGVLATIAGCGVLLASSGDDEPSTSDMHADAVRVCQGFVEDRLKAPATAEFSDISTTGVERITVFGSVDSENSFGAMIRNHFTCRVKLDGDQWTLISMTGLTN